MDRLTLIPDLRSLPTHSGSSGVCDFQTAKVVRRVRAAAMRPGTLVLDGTYPAKLYVRLARRAFPCAPRQVPGVDVEDA